MKPSDSSDDISTAVPKGPKVFSWQGVALCGLVGAFASGLLMTRSWTMNRNFQALQNV